MALWRGSPYAELTFESFLQEEIARLGELRSGAWETLMDAELALGHHAAAVVDLERLAGEAPIRERRWELLALALYRDGRQAEALRVLQQARQVLGEELGIEPGRRCDGSRTTSSPSRPRSTGTRRPRRSRSTGPSPPGARTTRRRRPTARSWGGTPSSPRC